MKRAPCILSVLSAGNITPARGIKHAGATGNLGPPDVPTIIRN